MASINQQTLAEHLRSVAEWRRGRMQDFDPDPRNLRSAEGLEQLADFWLALPEDDALVATLTELLFVGEMLQLGQRVEWEVPRYHFYHDQATPAGFLQHLLELAREDSASTDPVGLPMVAGDNPFTRPTRRYELSTAELLALLDEEEQDKP